MQAISRNSVEVLGSMAGRAQCVQSFVTDDELFCVCIGDDVDAIVEHARAGGFPCENVARVRAMMDPTTAERSG
jgi:hypothetical protein